MLRNLILFTLLALLASCGGNNTYHLKTSDAEDIKAGDKVLRQGVEIGEVTAVGFDITIAIEDALFEGQDFSFTRDRDGNRAVEMDRPRSSANELASGAILEDQSVDIDIAFDGLGDALEKGMDAFFGKDGAKLEEFGAIFEKFGNQTAEDLEKWGKEMEAWAKENEDEFKDLERKLEKWSDENEGAVEEWGKEVERISERYDVGSKEWRRELKKSIQELEN
jgi:hypothetical protein